MIEPLLVCAQETGRGKARAHRGARPVGGDRWGERDVVFVPARPIAKLKPPGLQVRPEARLVEAHTHTGMARGLLDEHTVQIRAPDRPDDLVLALPVGLQRGCAAGFVHHAPAHRDQQRPYARHHPGTLERAHPAGGEGKVDGAAALGLRLARIRAALVKRHGPAAPCQQYGEQRP